MADVLLHSGANVDATDSYGRTAIMWAVMNGHADVVNLLLAAHCNPNLTDSGGTSALAFAAQDNRLDTLKLLLKAGAKPAATDGTPLRYAIDNKNEEMTRVLLDAGADPCIEMGNEMGAYLAAGYEGTLPIANLLLERVNRCPNASKLLGPLLNDAAQRGELPIVKAVVDSMRRYRISVDAGKTDDVFGNRITLLTALASTIENRQNEVTRFLVENLPEIGPEGLGVLLVRTLKQKQSEVFQLLLDHGAAVDVPEPNGTTPLIQACLSADLPTARFLIGHGASFKKATDDGVTPLLAACRSGSVEIVELLLNKGATLNDKDKDKRGPLLNAAMNGSADICRFLAAHGVNVNVADEKSGFTALHYAAQNADPVLAKTLIALHANPSLRDKRGLLPRDYAEQRGATEILQLLAGNQPLTKAPAPN